MSSNDLSLIHGPYGHLNQNVFEMEGSISGLPFTFFISFLFICCFLFFVIGYFLKQKQGTISSNKGLYIERGCSWPTDRGKGHVEILTFEEPKKVISEYRCKNMNDQQTGTSTDLERVLGQLGEELHEDVLECILARISYPSILKVSELSRSWRLKFLSSSLYPSLFQREVSVISSKWTTYCPTFFTEDGIIGFDQTLSEWKLVAIYPRLLSRPEFITCVGALVCLASFLKPRVGVEYIVFNVLTKSMRLVKVPNSEHCKPMVVRLVPVGLFAYKLIVNTLKEIPGGDMNGVNRIHVLHVYHSETETWTETEMVSGLHVLLDIHHEEGTRFLVQHTACVNGIWYGLKRGQQQNWDGTKWTVWSFNTNANINVGASRSNRSPYNNLYVMAFLRQVAILHRILICEDRIIVCFCSLKAMREVNVPNYQRSFYNTPLDSILICELDKVTLQLTQIAKGPNEGMTAFVLELDAMSYEHWIGRLPYMQFTFHGSTIYFGRNNPFVPVLTFNLDTSRWGYLPAAPQSLCPMTEKNHVTWGQCAFQPGLNPFA